MDGLTNIIAKINEQNDAECQAIVDAAKQKADAIISEAKKEAEMLSAKIIKNAGGVITHPFGSVMRSLLVAIYELGVKEIMIVGHSDCGVQHMDSEVMLKHMIERGVSQDHIDMMEYCDINLREWLSGFDCVEQAVRQSVHIVKHHPLIPNDITVRGFLMDSTTGYFTEYEGCE